MTPKQERFANEYLLDMNATQAAIRAGYSKISAPSTGQRLANHPNVKAYMAKLQREAAENAGVTVEKVTKALADMAFLDFRDPMVPETVRESRLAKAATTVKLKMNAENEITGCDVQVDRRGALELLGKWLGMFTDKVEHSGNIEQKVDPEKVSDLELAKAVALQLRMSQPVDKKGDTGLPLIQ